MMTRLPEPLELYMTVLKDDFMSAWVHLLGVEAGTANPKSDFIDKLLTLFSPLINGIEFIPLPGSSIISAAISFAVEQGNSLRQENKYQHLKNIKYKLSRAQLEYLLNVVALEASRRYQWKILEIHKNQTNDWQETITQFAQVGIYRVFHFILTNKQEINYDTLLLGFIVGDSGGLIEGFKNNQIKRHTSQLSTSKIKNAANSVKEVFKNFFSMDIETFEGVYRRSPFANSDKTLFAKLGDGSDCCKVEKNENQPKYPPTLVSDADAKLIFEFRYKDSPARNVIEINQFSPEFQAKLSQFKPVIAAFTRSDLNEYLNAISDKSKPIKSLREYLSVKNNYPETIVFAVYQPNSAEDRQLPNLTGADLSGTNFTGCVFPEKLDNVNLNNSFCQFADFSHVKSGINFNARNTSFQNANFNGSQLIDASSIASSDFRYADMRGAIIKTRDSSELHAVFGDPIKGDLALTDEKTQIHGLYEHEKKINVLDKRTSQLEDDVKNLSDGRLDIMADPYYIRPDEIELTKKINPKHNNLHEGILRGNRKVAVKVFRDSSKEQFMREVNVLKKLLHSNIVKMIGFVNHDPISYFVTEWMLHNLAEAIDKQLITKEKQIDVISGVCAGLLYLHDANILHRDLRSENILLDENLHAKICNFGFSKLDDKSVKKVPLQRNGATHWLAPEIVNGGVHTKETDVYAFGLLMLVITTQAHLFSTLTNEQIKARKYPEIPDSIADIYRFIISRCHTIDPKNRMTVNDIHARLHDYAKNSSLSAEEYDKLNNSKFSQKKENKIAVSNEYQSEQSSSNDITLFEASRKGEVDVIRKILEEHRYQSKKFLDSVDDNGFTVLTLAVNQGHKNVVEILLGSDHLYYEDQFKTAMKIAEEKGYKEIELLMIGCILWRHISYKGNISAVKEILRRPDVNSFINLPVTRNRLFLNEKGDVPLIYAIRNNTRFAGFFAESAEIAWLLIKAGANVNIKDKDGNTPLHIACKLGNYEAYKLLLAVGASTKALNNKGETPRALAKHDTKVCMHEVSFEYRELYWRNLFFINQELIKVEAIDNVDTIKNSIEKSHKEIDSLVSSFLLHQAIARSQVRKVKEILKRENVSSFINMPNQFGLTPLISALKGSYGYMANFDSKQVDRCAGIDFTVGVNETAHYAAMFYIVTALLEAGTDVDVDCHGQSALGIATEKGYLKICSLIMAKKLKNIISPSLPIKEKLSNKNISASELQIAKDDKNKEKIIGEGSYGYVYAGTYKNKPVAIKKTKSKLVHGVIEELENEARIHMRLDSPYIIKLYGICFHGDKFSLVMECADKGSLRDFYREEELPWATRMNIAIDIARGLEYLHAMRIIHRDLKSSNVLITANFVAKLSDFGFARAQDSVSQSGSTNMVGSLYWIAPEIMNFIPTEGNTKIKYNSKTDIYAFGVTLFEMSERKLPFGYLQNASIAAARAAMGQRDTMSEHPLKQVIERCWAQDPDNRPSAAEAIAMLGLIKNKTPNTVTTQTPTQQQYEKKPMKEMQDEPFFMSLRG